MLSALYSHTESRLVNQYVPADSDSDDGIFENTPAPSNRSSFAVHRPILESLRQNSPSVTTRKHWRRQGHRPSMFTKMTTVPGDAEKEPLILFRDKIGQNFIPARKSSVRSRIAADDGNGKENPGGLGSPRPRKQLGGKRLRIDARHGLSACLTFPVDDQQSSEKLFAPIPTRVRPKLSLVDMAHSHSDNVTAASDAALLPKSALKRSYSVGSLLDYTRASKWLRDMLWYPESYTTKLTQRPPKSGSRPNAHSTIDNPSLADIQLARRVTGLSKHSTRSDSRFDGFLFRRAVSDLERLVNEAVTMASQAVEFPEHDFSKSPCSQSSSSGGSNSDSEAPFSSENNLSDLADDFSSPRPACKHANTFSAVDNRPRLREVVEKYSDDGVMPRSEEYPQVHRHVTFQLPGTAMGEDGNQSFSVHPQMHVKTPLRGQREGHRAYATPYQTATDAGPQKGYRIGDEQLPERDIAGRQMPADYGISLRRRSHVSLDAGQRFNLARSHRRQPIARDWSKTRKRFVASVACISTALIGIILGIYAGLVPSIQYYVIDPAHIVVHGNTGCFFGMAIPTFFFWPLPLLHGRKPYILTGLVIAMPLLFPQALAVTSQRLMDSVEWRSLLLASRTLMGISLGFAGMNFHSILTDLFGASLMSVNPHQEVVDHYDARRHGGGMGVWLGIWTWSWIGSLGVGFLVGASIIDKYTPTWGFYVSIILIAVVLFLNVVCPEVRRSAYRRSVAEVRTGPDISRRVARGEIMMHRAKTGPRWWGEEVYHGIVLSMEMLRQPGFLVMAVYSSWIYCQVVLIIVLLGSLASRYYRFRSPEVGLLVASMALGAFLAIPFQKANLFSRSRFAQLNTSKATLDRKVVWSSHMVRRTVFSLLLPLAGICYAAVSTGPPTHISLPTIFSLCVGFLSCLAISECNGLIMETFDCSDLSPGMTGRQRGSSARNPKRTNYSSFPRVTAGFALIHTFAFILAAGSTALGGHVTRTLGQQVATGVVAGILFVLTILLLLVLVRFVEIQIIPRSKFDEMDRVVEARRKSTIRRASMPNDPQAMIEEEQAWRPIMIGNPIGKTRRMNILELGSMTRWQEIRKKNRLIDAGAHLNRGALGHGLGALDDQMSDLKRNFRIGSGKKKTRRMYRSDESSETGNDLDFDGYSMSNLSTPGRNRQGGEREDPMETAMIDEELGRAQQK
ncbi:hypothetical protein NLG97_g7899 [Lecanicillium saksenae]|uniref:Uncharacterized protein n=1 Tax=Lecanicillium saksenae TaxID=468837 RepID=A0ACC1QKJ8_9HYPO|nr:hypothetical protein NLG97_g7899 [Lecanicillium saksenae]